MCLFGLVVFLGGGGFRGFLNRRIGLLCGSDGVLLMDDGMLFGWDGVLTRLVFVAFEWLVGVWGYLGTSPVLK